MTAVLIVALLLTALALTVTVAGADREAVALWWKRLWCDHEWKIGSVSSGPNRPIMVRRFCPRCRARTRDKAVSLEKLKAYQNEEMARSWFWRDIIPRMSLIQSIRIWWMR